MRGAWRVACVWVGDLWLRLRLPHAAPAERNVHAMLLANRSQDDTL